VFALGGRGMMIRPGLERKKDECSFLKKRTKKLLPMAHGAGEARTRCQKFFASFFQKRRPSLPTAPTAA
jgi:hypothetical protein